jgi:hypothetical protein
VIPATRLESIEDWKAFNATCKERCGAFVIIGADWDDAARAWFGLITLITEADKPEYYSTLPLYSSRAVAFRQALRGASNWTSLFPMEGGCVVPPEELRKP